MACDVSLFVYLSEIWMTDHAYSSSVSTCDSSKETQTIMDMVGHTPTDETQSPESSILTTTLVGKLKEVRTCSLLWSYVAH